MTGRIKSLDSVTASGVITAADGLMVGFYPSAVLAYDVPILAVGQVVSFDLEGGRRPKALNVCVQRAAPALKAQESRVGITRLRYVGFQQVGSIRSYLFEMFAPGEQRATFTVNADLTLFTRHHVGIQEGPVLCLRLLAAEPDLAGAAAQTSLGCSLTDREMLAHLASRPVPRAKHCPKRTPPASSATSRLA